MAISHRGMDTTSSPYNDMSAAPVASGSAVQDAGDPYANTKNVQPMYALYPGWAQEETPATDSEWRRNSSSYQLNGVSTGLTAHSAALPFNKPGLTTRLSEYQTRFENVMSADEGPLAQDLTPHSDGTISNEPNNWSGQWKIPRILRAGIGYTFFRNWEKSQQLEEGFDGSHVSVADNAVILPVGGMSPNQRKNMRNTYRVDPEPWDLNCVDRNVDPTANPTPPVGAMTPPNVSYGSSYRLG